jgi:hypothetical protein
MSTLRTNALEGVDAKNSITIVAGAGNITTTNVQEGLAKCWVNFDGNDSTPSARDSFNLSSIADSGTGDYELSITNAFSTGDFCSTACCEGDSSNDNRSVCTNNNSSSEVYVNVCVCTSGSASDVDEVHLLTHGDLA